MKIASFVSALVLGAFASGSAFAVDASAQDYANKPDASAAARSAKSAECTKEADVKGLVGKTRRTFHHQCMNSK